MDDLQILRVKETAKLLGISVPTIYRWAEEGNLPFPKIQIGRGSVGFRRKDVAKHINDQVESQSKLNTEQQAENHIGGKK